ncbi:GlcG/HbpS family heme-binding protein [Frigidibacter sp. ROC022]|uniref:GlcG/HbpS family heme-binding protein n=1 Tax=Frigidibacter sp. ROC022 TaxID=2971796 RepID=UPI00215B0A4A|nr:heme-binding protein [Frigidibacter sp. ROC022]MCR8725350.1 heme-binding protein [Frigidibacter sp. ROC022]
MAEITLRKAKTIIKAALAEAKTRGFNPLAVVVLDAGGHLKAAEREDATSAGRAAVAEAKAYGAVMLGMSGSALRDRAEIAPQFVSAANGVFGGKLVPVPGGVLVRDSKGALIGAVGVSGDTSDNDAIAAMAGITAAGLVGEV